MKNREKLIEKFLEKLGKPKSKEFTIICNSCKLTNIVFYDDMGVGSEYTGTYGDAGIKCKGCGNVKEIINF